MKTMKPQSLKSMNLKTFDDGGHQTLEDNYFDLLPGISRQIRVTKPASSGEYPLAAVLPIAEK